AAAISLPEILDNGSPFPQRDMMIYLTFCVIFVTLVLQGLALPPLIRKLGLAGAGGKNPEETNARRAMNQAAVAYLEELRENDRPEFAPLYDELIQSQNRRLNLLADDWTEDNEDRREEYERFRSLMLQLQSVQRAAILHLR